MAGNGQTVIELDRKRMQAMAAKDIATLDSLLADDLVYTHSSARLDTKQSLIVGMTSGSTVYTSLEPSDVKAQDFGDTVAERPPSPGVSNRGANGKSHGFRLGLHARDDRVKAGQLVLFRFCLRLCHSPTLPRGSRGKRAPRRPGF